jgi:integrase
MSLQSIQLLNIVRLSYKIYFNALPKTEHLVPLATQAVAILRDLYLLTGHGEYLFPGRDPKQPISNSTLNAALVRMGYDTSSLSDILC